MSFGLRGVEAGRGLVQQEQARLARQCTRDREPLLLATGEPPCWSIRQGREAH